jgi:hypothetical protein
MTYEESYMKCETLNQLKEELKKDIVIASIMNTDRLKPINDAGIKVAKLKFGEEIK